MRKTFSILIIFVALNNLVHAKCGKSRRLAGAAVAKVGDFPYLVAILHPKVRCTGSLLSQDWVLSAAHCTVLEGRLVKAEDMHLVAGVVDFMDDSPTKQVRRAEQIYPHPNFQELKIAGSDVALIRVESMFEMGPFVSTIPVSGSPFPVDSDIQCTASGWGDTLESSINSRLHTLRVVAVQSKSACHGLSHRERKHMICLRNKGGAGLCDGDSGGPLICNNSVVGVAHQVYMEKSAYTGPHDMECGSRGLVHTYMFLCPYLDWMRGLVTPRGIIPPKPDRCFVLRPPFSVGEV